MLSRQDRRAAALEAIAHALLELAAVEREPEDPVTPKEILIDHRNCEAELGLAPRAFTAAAARGDFPAFRVSKRQTATKEDVLSWLKSRKVEPKPGRVREVPKKADDPDAFLKQVHGRFVARLDRPMTDHELSNADTCIEVGHAFAKMTNRDFTDTPDAVAARVIDKIGQEPVYYKDWRSFGLDPAKMERDAEDLRVKLHAEHPEWTWRERQRAVDGMWSAVTEPLYEARRKARAEARAAKKAEKARRGELGLKK
jgi:hypothetical protein